MAEKDSNIVENGLDLKFISGLCLQSLSEETRMSMCLQEQVVQDP